jgi:uncharacterized membrane protein
MEYLIVKWLHVISSTLLFGTGIGSAFYMLMACLNQDAAIAYFVVRKVVIADWLFTATSVVVQPLTGFYLVNRMGLPFTTGWIWWSIVLYLVAGACWLPVVWLQMRMRDLARHAAEGDQALPAQYWQYFRWWFALGIPAFISLLIVFYLMVAKPS